MQVGFVRTLTFCLDNFENPFLQYRREDTFHLFSFHQPELEPNIALPWELHVEVNEAVGGLLSLAEDFTEQLEQKQGSLENVFTSWQDQHLAAAGIKKEIGSLQYYDI